jgi:hypothetical protein
MFPRTHISPVVALIRLSGRGPCRYQFLEAVQHLASSLGPESPSSGSVPLLPWWLVLETISLGTRTS